MVLSFVQLVAIALHDGLKEGSREGCWPSNSLHGTFDEIAQWISISVGGKR